MNRLRGNPWAVLVVVSLGFFMTLLDLTIVNIAIPNTIARLHASLDGVLWVLNAYALVLAVLVITAGRLGDIIGMSTLFLTGIVWLRAAPAGGGYALRVVLAPALYGVCCFCVNLPIGVVVFAVTFFIVPDLHPGRRHGLDFRGVALASLGLLAICYGLVEGQNYDWGTIASFVSIPLILAVGVLLIGVFLVDQKR